MHASNDRRMANDTATAGDYADYADILVTAAGGYVSPEAEAAIGQTLKRDPKNGVALYYLGAMELQIGRPDRAFQIWRTVLENSPADAPWVAPIQAQIADAATRAGVDYTPAPAAAAPRGPSAADMQAAGQMTPEARAEMIRNMVAGLSERLNSQGGTPAEWAQLITALGVLGESEQATAALDKAQQAYAGNDAALAQIGEAATRAGLTQ